MNFLVTGGAGYIGSHATRHFLDAGHDVVVLDDFSRGHRAAVDAIARAAGRRPVVAERSLAETGALAALLREHAIDCVVHFAAFANVGESVEHPLRYYRNNTAGTLSLLEAMAESGVNRLVFSSTCATYGEPAAMPIVETMPQHPVNPYGASKYFIERMLADHAAARPEFACAALRYFNVAGCAEDGALGEDHDPETHLIPVTLQVALGRRPRLAIFGTDYPTPDGTCVRDYIHVEDLVEAHGVVAEALEPGDVRAYNLGIGRGHSVREVIEAARRVTGHPVPAEEAPRRPGDPPELWADASKIERELGWSARRRDLDDIVASAWRWFRAHPDGYANARGDGS